MNISVAKSKEFYKGFDKLKYDEQLLSYYQCSSRAEPSFFRLRLAFKGLI
jgi:hypothetical protein